MPVAISMPQRPPYPLNNIIITTSKIEKKHNTMVDGFYDFMEPIACKMSCCQMSLDIVYSLNSNAALRDWERSMSTNKKTAPYAIALASI